MASTFSITFTIFETKQSEHARIFTLFVYFIICFYFCIEMHKFHKKIALAVIIFRSYKAKYDVLVTA
jgi:hypothetical protein